MAAARAESLLHGMSIANDALESGPTWLDAIVGVDASQALAYVVNPSNPPDEKVRQYLDFTRKGFTNN